MALALYMDHHVSRAITDALRVRRIDVLTAEEDGTKEYEDPILLDRARELRRILFTRDQDFLKEASFRQKNHIDFYGIVFAHQLLVPIRVCINDLELICSLVSPEDSMNTLFYLPL